MPNSTQTYNKTPDESGSGDPPETTTDLCPDCAKIDFESIFTKTARAWERDATVWKSYLYFHDLTKRSDWHKWRTYSTTQKDATFPPPYCWLCQNLFVEAFQRPGLLEQMDLWHLCAVEWWTPYELEDYPNPRQTMLMDPENGAPGPDLGFRISMVSLQPYLRDLSSPIICIKEPINPWLLVPRLGSQYTDLSIVKRWLEACSEYHEDCSSWKSMPTPLTRLIDCVDRRVVRATTQMVYVALSYVWGQPSSVVSHDWTTQLGRLPQTIEDAITVTKALGHRYLWVDKYCIKQDDEADKVRQIRLMGEIYQHAALTIIAASGKDDNHGISGVGRRRKPIVYSRGPLRLTTTPRRPEWEVQDSVWNSRGWTFQESMLSQRRLVFTDTSVAYSCPESRAHDGAGCSEHVTNKRMMRNYDLVMPAKWHLPSLPAEDEPLSSNITQFQEITTVYSLREFTYASDIFRGFRGISTEFETLSPPIFNIYGIPFAITTKEKTSEQMFLRGLVFYGRSSLRPDQSRSIFPHWSWAKFMGVGKVDRVNGLFAPRPEEASYTHVTNVRLQVDNKSPLYTLQECVENRLQVSPELEFRILHVDAHLLSAVAFIYMMKQLGFLVVEFHGDYEWVLEETPNGRQMSGAERNDGILEQLSSGAWGLVLLDVVRRFGVVAQILIIKWQVTDDGVRWGQRIGIMCMTSEEALPKSDLGSFFAEYGVTRKRIQLR